MRREEDSSEVSNPDGLEENVPGRRGQLVQGKLSLPSEMQWVSGDSQSSEGTDTEEDARTEAQGRLRLSNEGFRQKVETSGGKTQEQGLDLRKADSWGGNKNGENTALTMKGNNQVI